MKEIQELFADIRNKLQRFKTVLEKFHSKRIPPDSVIELTLKDLEDIDVLFSDYESKLRKEE